MSRTSSDSVKPRIVMLTISLARTGGYIAKYVATA